MNCRKIQPSKMVHAHCREREREWLFAQAQRIQRTVWPRVYKWSINCVSRKLHSTHYDVVVATVNEMTWNRKHTIMIRAERVQETNIVQSPNGLWKVRQKTLQTLNEFYVTTHITIWTWNKIENVLALCFGDFLLVRPLTDAMRNANGDVLIRLCTWRHPTEKFHFENRRSTLTEGTAESFCHPIQWTNLRKSFIIHIPACTLDQSIGHRWISVTVNNVWQTQCFPCEHRTFVHADELKIDQMNTVLSVFLFVSILFFLRLI